MGIYEDYAGCRAQGLGPDSGVLQGGFSDVILNTH